jgi:hypothetical protein
LNTGGGGGRDVTIIQQELTEHATKKGVKGADKDGKNLEDPSRENL